MNFMYWRYFLWNFVGRQSDIQSTGEITDGNWLSGIQRRRRTVPRPAGPTCRARKRQTKDEIPTIFTVHPRYHRADLPIEPRRQKLYGRHGLLHHDGRGDRRLPNSPPAEPRERDYVFAGSFYAFCMWIGFGVPALYEAFKRWFKERSRLHGRSGNADRRNRTGPAGAKNWDDHDRAGRFVAHDFG